MSLVLASQSPRRKELLAQLGYCFSCQSADIDESVLADETPSAYVERLARAKAEAVSQPHNDDTVVLGSDTSVVINGQILGKPSNQADCTAQLQLLSGQQHQVLTAIAASQQGQTKSVVVTTQVTFKKLTLTEIENYWLTGEPQDKAGSYGIQGIGGQFVTHIAGSYFAVVGLPLYETEQLLTSMGLATPLQQA